MNLSFGKKRHYSLVGNGTNLALAEIVKSTPPEVASFKLLAATDSEIDVGTSLPRLLANVSGTKGDTSVVLSLSSFQILTITLPQMPESAIAKALPYHISKTIDRPLSDCVFDWQLTAAHGNQLYITVYLLPKAFYENLREELARKQLTVTFLEADVFAAFAYLERTNNLRPGEVTLCALIWPHGVSLAIYENRVLSLVRAINISKPVLPYSKESVTAYEAIAAEPEIEISAQEAESDIDENNRATIDFFSEEEIHTDILAGFDVQTKSAPKAESAVPITPNNQPEGENQRVAQPATTAPQSWPEYLRKISFEIMRTREYHATMLKGKPLASIYVAGAEDYWDEMADIVKSTLGVHITPLTSKIEGENCPAILSVILQGAGTRWS